MSFAVERRSKLRMSKRDDEYSGESVAASELTGPLKGPGPPGNTACASFLSLLNDIGDTCMSFLSSCSLRPNVPYASTGEV